MSKAPCLTLETWLWQHAVPLTEAPVRLAPEPLRNALADTKPRHFIHHMLEAMEAEKKQETADLDRFLDTASQSMQPAIDAQKDCEEHLLAALLTGEATGFGFEAMRRSGDSPMRIPTEVWASAPGWTDNRIEAEGFSFLEVRLLLADQEADLTEEWRTAYLPKPRKRPSGPVGTSRQIEDAYRALKAAGRVDTSANLLAHYDTVRQWLMTYYPNDGFTEKRPSDETLRKTLRPLFEDS